MSKRTKLSIYFCMKILSAICLILGCFMGAGFVSGREVSFYFSKYGGVSYLSCIICGILFFLLTMFFFLISSRVKSTSQFISVYFKKSSRLVEWLFAICILIFTGSMFAGTAELAKSLDYNQILIVSITILLTLLVVINNVKCVSNVNVILVPILIIVLLFAMNSGELNIVECCNDIVGATISGSAYVFINIVTLGLLIIEIGHKYSRKEKVIISLVATIIITSLLIYINHSIISNNLVDYTMPNLTLSSRNSVLYVMMQIGIYLGLFTTIISNVFLLSNFISNYIKSRVLSVVISIILGLFVSLCGFENIVGFVYIFICFVGILVVWVTLIKNSKEQKKIGYLKK